MGHGEGDLKTRWPEVSQFCELEGRAAKKKKKKNQQQQQQQQKTTTTTNNS
jgi:hypothetical protein